MIKVKTFTNELKIFHARQELKELDELVNTFIEKNNVKNVCSVSDSTTSSEGGTVGIIRVMAYEV